MRIFVYEFITGGGLLHEPNLATVASLLQEGAAMIAALAADFAALAGVEVEVMRDARMQQLAVPACRVVEVGDADQESQTFSHLAAQADWTVLIAPEIGGVLLDRCRRVIQAGGRLLGPGEGLIALASDKHATAEHLRSQGVPAPRGVRRAANEMLPADFGYPAVCKPLDGAGSQGVERVRSPIVEGEPRRVFVASRLEAYCPGLAASVAFLCGRDAFLPLLPCRQHLSDDGRFTYLGGSLPLEPCLAERAAHLARSAIERLPQPFGYIGIDLVLGDDPAGSQDYVIEVNPRLTTSYIGLRARANGNLAQSMLALAEGTMPVLSWRDKKIDFSATG